MKTITQITFNWEQLRLTPRYLMIYFEGPVAGRLHKTYRARKRDVAEALTEASLDSPAFLPYQRYDNTDGWIDFYPALVCINRTRKKKGWALEIGCQSFTLENLRAIKAWAGVR